MSGPERIDLIGKRVLDTIERRCRDGEAKQHRRQPDHKRNLLDDSPKEQQSQPPAGQNQDDDDNYSPPDDDIPF